MAKFIPNVRLDEITHQSEQLVYAALASLGDDFIVLHSYPWLRPRRDLKEEPLREGEADFVVLHPGHGLLVVEVKGGEPVLRHRVWYRGSKEMKDPFQQARRSRYALLEAIEERTRRRVTRDLFTHGDLVVFPNASCTGPLPLDADPRTLVDARGLPELARLIVEAFAAWERRPVMLSRALFAELVDALLPKLRLVRCVGPDIEDERARIVQLTENQTATLMGLLATKRVLVEGVAGSGKTLLAFEFSAALAREGKRVLMLCYNKHLAVWLQEQLAEGVVRDPRLASIELSTFHAAAFKLAARAGVEFSVPDGPADDFWDNEAPLILEQAIEVLSTRGQTVQYDAVVVDEGQDFCRDWWVTVQSLTRGGAEGQLYVFMDRQQSLRGDDRPPPLVLPARFVLRTNCRNTKNIAASAAALAAAQVDFLPGTPDGEVPSLRRAPIAAAEAGLVLEEVRRLLRGGLKASQIALIGPSNKDRGALSGVSAVDGVQLTKDAALWRRGDGLLVTTARAFKGLEADVVILYDLAALSPGFSKTDLYVAWTRAKHRLVLVCHGADVRKEIEGALADAARALKPLAVPAN